MNKEELDYALKYSDSIYEAITKQMYQSQGNDSGAAVAHMIALFIVGIRFKKLGEYGILEIPEFTIVEKASAMAGLAEMQKIAEERCNEDLDKIRAGLKT